MIYAKTLILAALILAPAFAQPSSVTFITVNGQSLSVGWAGSCGAGSNNGIGVGDWTCSSSISSPHGDSNLMLSYDGNFYRTTGPLRTLAEIGTPWYSAAGSSYGGGTASETVSTSIANQMTYLASLEGKSLTAAAGAYGIPGAGYGSWQKGASATAGYGAQLTAITAMKSLVLALGAQYYVPAHVVIGGETDFSGNVTASTWESNLVGHQGNIQGDLVSAISQTGLVPLFLTQQSDWNSWPGPHAYPTTDYTEAGPLGVPFGVVKAFKDHYADGSIFAIGPMYQYRTEDYAHLIASQRSGNTEMGYRELGAKIGQAIYQVTRRRKGWKPVYPRQISVSGTAVTIRFFTETQLVLDTTWRADRTNCGFEVRDSGDATTAIAGSGHACAANTNVTVSGTDTVLLTLNHAPSGTLTVRYAYTPAGGVCPGDGANNTPQCAGSPGGAWGNLRDSDPTRSWSNDTGVQTVFLYNPALMFREDAPYSLTMTEPNLSSIPGPAVDPVPVTYYSDLINGMCTGGKDNQGHIITVNGSGFGATRGSSVVTLTSGGTSQNASTYLQWSDAKIAFQPGCSFANGTDTTITVTTTSGGTSNGLPFHIYTGGTIYFVDNGAVTGVTGNDSNNGLTPASPFLTFARCLHFARAVAGNACYVMPGYVQDTGFFDDNSVYAYLPLVGVAGTSDKYISIIGYPAATQSQLAMFGGTSVASGQIGRATNSKYLVVSNVRLASPGNYEAIYLGYQPDGGVHHIRLINADVTMTTATATTAITLTYASHVQIYGFFGHDITNTSGGKHVGYLYVGDSSHDIDMGWNTFDATCLFNGTPCLNGKQTESHVTNLGDAVPSPSQPVLTAASGGSLTAGTYDVQLTYGGQAYNFTTFGQDATETMPSTARSISLNGTTQTAISIAHPPGFQRWPSRDDGDTVICNPTLNYKVYACLRSNPAVACTPSEFQLQATSNFSNATVYDSITGSDYTLTSIASGAAPPACVFLSNQGGGDVPGCAKQMNVRGCNMYNLAIHDSVYIDSPDYALTLGTNVDANPPHFMRVYNNVILNGGNYANAANNNEMDAVCLSIAAPDPQTQQVPQGGTFDIFNNTFFNCGSPYTYWSSLGIIDMSGSGWSSSFPTLHINMDNNIMYQPQANQPMLGSSAFPSVPNITFGGSHNLCYAPLNGDHGVCPSAWNSGGGGLNADPLFTSAGVSHTLSVGGPYWDGLDLNLASGSPAIGAGVDRGLGTTIGAIRGPYQAPPSASSGGTRKGGRSISGGKIRH